MINPPPDIDDSADSRTNDRGETETEAQRAVGDNTTASDDETAPITDIEAGRYLYCLVRTDRRGDTAFETTGIEGEPVRIIGVDGIGAVTHTCSGLYDTANISQLQQWVIQHQSVVDEAGDAFGTPLPVRFDTIIRGGDNVVRDWLESNHARIERTLETFAEHWEYRIDVAETIPIDEATLREHDERLRDLATQIDDADPGRAFLLESQYDERMANLREQRRAALYRDLCDRLDDHAREITTVESTVDLNSASATNRESSKQNGTDTLCRLSILAHESLETAIGSVLDDVASHDTLTVTFTGPWPPYSFTPALDANDVTTDTGKEAVSEQTVAEKDRNERSNEVADGTTGVDLDMDLSDRP